MPIQVLCTIERPKNLFRSTVVEAIRLDFACDTAAFYLGCLCFVVWVVSRSVKIRLREEFDVIDEDIKQKAQRLLHASAEKDAALRNAQQEVELGLKQLDAHIQDVSNILNELNAQKQELLKLLGRPDPLKKPKRQEPGSLITAYTDALTSNPQGMKSREIVAWLQKNRPELKTTSIPAVLSRGIDDGRLKKDEQGRFHLL